ncbi:MAG: AarF/UbiB family protein [Chloroflexota bacterium]|nr:AarF/UbiB family protein [Chloroflexota bacterium]
MIEPDAWEFVKTIVDVGELIEATKAKVKPQPWYKTVLGRIVRGLVAELGSTFIKLAQIMSMRPEMPPFLREQLQVLQDRLSPLTPGEVRNRLKIEIGKPVDEVFEWVEDQPVASASLGVVHRAKLKGGDEVALKIQRPYLKGTIKLDTIILFDLLIPIFQVFLPLFRRNDLTVFIRGFRLAIEREIDFLQEGRVQDKMLKDFQTHPVYRENFKIAKVYFEYTTNKLLTMEFVKGFHRIDSMFEELSPNQIWEIFTQRVPEYPQDKPFHLYYVLPLFLGDMLYRWGLYHSDLHLGNLYLQEPQYDGDRWRWFLCDFGMYHDLTVPEAQELGRQFFVALVYTDAELLIQLFQKIIVEQGGDLSNLDWGALKEKMNSFLRRRHVVEEAMETEEALAAGAWGITGRGRWHGTQSYVTEIIQTFIPELLSHGARLPHHLWMIAKCFAYIEETVQTLYGGMDYAGIFTPHIRRFAVEDALELLDGANRFVMEDRVTEIVELFGEVDRPKVSRVFAEVLAHEGTRTDGREGMTTFTVGGE